MYLQYKALRYNESFKDGAGLLWGFYSHKKKNSKAQNIRLKNNKGYETLGELTVLRTNGSKYKEIYSRLGPKKGQLEDLKRWSNAFLTPCPYLG